MCEPGVSLQCRHAQQLVQSTSRSRSTRCAYARSSEVAPGSCVECHSSGSGVNLPDSACDQPKALPRLTQLLLPRTTCKIPCVHCTARTARLPPTAQLLEPARIGSNLLEPALVWALLPPLQFAEGSTREETINQSINQSVNQSVNQSSAERSTRE